MPKLFHRIISAGVLALGLTAGSGAMAQNAICYNCPTEWADWGPQLRAIKEKTGVTIPADNKNSGQALAQLVAEKANPVADVAYLGVSFAIQAQKVGVLAPYQPATARTRTGLDFDNEIVTIMTVRDGAIRTCLEFMDLHEVRRTFGEETSIHATQGADALAGPEN